MVAVVISASTAVRSSLPPTVAVVIVTSPEATMVAFSVTSAVVMVTFTALRFRSPPTLSVFAVTSPVAVMIASPATSSRSVLFRFVTLATRVPTVAVVMSAFTALRFSSPPTLRVFAVTSPVAVMIASPATSSRSVLVRFVTLATRVPTVAVVMSAFTALRFSSPPTLRVFAVTSPEATMVALPFTSSSSSLFRFSTLTSRVPMVAVVISAFTAVRSSLPSTVAVVIVTSPEAAMVALIPTSSVPSVTVIASMVALPSTVSSGIASVSATSMTASPDTFIVSTVRFLAITSRLPKVAVSMVTSPVAVMVALPSAVAVVMVTSSAVRFRSPPAVTVSISTSPGTSSVTSSPALTSGRKMSPLVIRSMLPSVEISLRISSSSPISLR